MLIKKTIKKGTKKTIKKQPKALVMTCSCCSFWASNGAVLRTLVDLRNELEKMTAEEFSKHATAEKNDFAAWVGTALEEATLAKAMRTVKTQKALVKKISEHLKKTYNI